MAVCVWGWSLGRVGCRGLGLSGVNARFGRRTLDAAFDYYYALRKIAQPLSKLARTRCHP